MFQSPLIHGTNMKIVMLFIVRLTQQYDVKLGYIHLMYITQLYIILLCSCARRTIYTFNVYNPTLHHIVVQLCKTDNIYI